MLALPAPVIERHAGLLVVRDDLLEGGSKTRFLPVLIGDAREVVFGGPFCGGAPLALSVLGRRMGIRVTLFYAKRKLLHPRQVAALRNGATIYQVPAGYMTNVQAKARAYCQATGAKMLPLGFDLPEAQEPFVAVIRSVQERVGDPPQVWCATGSGMLARCLAMGFPRSEVHGVAVGLASRWKNQQMPGNVVVHQAAVPFARESKAQVPFPSCPNYDRKAWELASTQAQPGSLFWNVLGPTV